MAAYTLIACLTLFFRLAVSRTIGLHHLSESNSTFGCINTLQGPYLLSDSQGFVCSMMYVDPKTGCCPKEGDPFSCRGCNLKSQCCNSYEFCVSCCLNPSRTRRDAVLRLKVARQITAGAYNTVFDYCMARCRHNSASVVHENAYASEEHHCFSQQTSSDATQHIEAEEPNYSLISSRQGQSCTAACQARGQSCTHAKLSEINKCSDLRKYMNCKGTCMASSGLHHPAEVVSTAPRYLHPGACLFSAKESSLSCEGTHPYVRRLCPCG